METERIGVVVVDVQADFTQFRNGSLAVEGTDELYLKAVVDGTRKLKETGISVFATQDWHPANHVSFLTNHKGKKVFDVVLLHGKDQVLWPPHCVQGSSGAEILLDKTLSSAVVRKGTHPEYDSYSGFQDDCGKKTELDQILKSDKITKIVLYGLATDYCVRATALDAASLGYNVVLVRGLCRGVAPGTSQRAIEEMKTRGIVVLENLDLEKIR
jgi:nicotinamidase/pyrazinamidase